jgi:branched-chain amino acid transport system substrate-binding protein
VNNYEAAHGKGSVSSFGGHAWDAGMLLQNAIPQALKKAQPGTKEFRRALRDALENDQERRRRHTVSST